jgi:hypothetical protein
MEKLACATVAYPPRTTHINPDKMNFLVSGNNKKIKKLIQKISTYISSVL